MPRQAFAAPLRRRRKRLIIFFAQFVSQTTPMFVHPGKPPQPLKKMRTPQNKATGGVLVLQIICIFVVGI